MRMMDRYIILTNAVLGSSADGSVAVPLGINIWTAIGGSIFCKFMVLAVDFTDTGLHLAAVAVKVIYVAVDLHQAALEFACICCIVPSAVSLDPASTHQLVVAKVKPVIFVLYPVVGAVGTVAPRYFTPWGVPTKPAARDVMALPAVRARDRAAIAKRFFIDSFLLILMITAASL